MQLISKLSLKYIPRMKSFKVYVKVSLENLNMKNNVYKMFLECSMVSLQRYHDIKILFILGLKGTMLSSDPEYTNVTKAWNFIKDLLERSEQEIIIQEKMSNAREALSKLDGLRVKYTQIPLLHLEGPAKKLPRRSMHRRLLDRYLFLFSEYLVMTEPPNTVGRCQVKSEIRLAGMTLYELEDDDVVEINVEHCFRIKAKELCVEIAFSNADEKQLWWRELQQAIDFECNKSNINCSDEKQSLLTTNNNNYINNLGQVAAQWVKDESSTMCTNCCTEFTTLNRRHHCRACGKLFCGSCSAYKAPLESSGGKYERVCVVDYYIINKNFKPPKPEIMEAILRRVDKQPSSKPPSRTGFLLWSRFNNSWSTKSPIRLPKSSIQYRSIDRNVDFRKSLLLRPPPPPPPLRRRQRQQDFNAINSSTNSIHINHNLIHRQTCLINQELLNHKLFSSSSSSSQPQPQPQPPPLLPVPLPPPPSSLSSSPSSSSSSSTSTVCLSRLFCALQTDTSFEFYAARANTRAVDKLTVIGLRLFYLDNQNIDVKDSRVVVDAVDAADAADGDDVKLTNHTSSDSFKQPIKTLPQVKSHSFDNHSLINKALLIEELSSIYKQKHQQQQQQQGVVGNPVYRLCKPPPRNVNLFQQHNEMTTSLVDIHSLKSTTMVMMNKLELDKLSKRPTQSCRERIFRKDNNSISQLTMINNKHLHHQSNNNVVVDVDGDDGEQEEEEVTGSIVTNTDILKHIESINPEILSVLRNNLGFLLLPLNTDRPAHYFEATTMEIRTQWINSIRRVCIDFMSSSSSSPSSMMS
ncbi:unnamed protein product [Schistosoma turkestanicum]|nr:unnamed protein product [Schistosoma turkestanicum]